VLPAHSYTDIHTGCPLKKFTQSLVKIDLVQLKINILDSAVLLVFEPFKNIDFQMSYGSYSETGVNFFLTHQVFNIKFFNPEAHTCKFFTLIYGGS